MKGAAIHRSFNRDQAFFDSVKPLSLEEEKDLTLGCEPEI